MLIDRNGVKFSIKEGKLRFIFNLLSLIVLHSILNCNSEKDLEIQELKSNYLNIDKSLILNPEDIFIKDSTLYLTDKISNSNLSLFDLNSLSLIGRYLYDDSIKSLYHLRFYSSNKFSFIDIQNNRFFILDYDSIENFSLEKSSENIHTKFNLNSYLMSPVLFKNRYIISIGNFNSGKYILIDKTLETPNKYYFSYPTDTTGAHIYDTDKTKSMVYQGQLFINDTKIAYFSAIEDYYQILEFDNNQMKVIKNKGPNIFPKYVYNSKNNLVTIQKESQVYYTKGFANKNFIFILNNKGTERINYQYAKSIDVFNWKGELLIRYTLDRDVKSIFVDEEHKLIYGVSKNSITFEPDIVYFKY